MHTVIYSFSHFVHVKQGFSNNSTWHISIERRYLKCNEVSRRMYLKNGPKQRSVTFMKLLQNQLCTEYFSIQCTLLTS